MTRSSMNKAKHLPLYGVGPLIVWGQFALTGLAILLSWKLELRFPAASGLRYLFAVAGVGLVLAGLYLDLSAKLKSKIFDSVKENKLITDGVYAWVRNPVYSGALLASTGAVLLVNNLLLLAVPPLCWLYMTLLLKATEEKWLRALYGPDYEAYCRRVNRCIPWFPRRGAK